VPLHIRFRAGLERGQVKAWIAMGAWAIGGLFGLGGLSVAPISFGGLAAGIFCFGGCGVGLVSLTDSALGYSRREGWLLAGRHLVAARWAGPALGEGWPWRTNGRREAWLWLATRTMRWPTCYSQKPSFFESCNRRTLICRCSAWSHYSLCFCGEKRSKNGWKAPGMAFPEVHHFTY